MASSSTAPAAAPIDGIILAAGQSRRMGRPKAALTGPGGASFLHRAVQTLRAAACRRVLVVVNSASAAAAEPDCEVVVNADAGSEPIDSVRLALARLDDTTAAVLVLPVDLPLILPETAAAVATAFRARAAPIVVPCHDGTTGHPILLARVLFDEVLHRDWDEGMRSVLQAHAHETHTVGVNDPGIVIDIDTPDDYARHVGP